VADAWLPGAGRLQSRHHGGPLQGGAPRAVWHTSETDPLRVSARSAAERLEQQGRNAHVVWNPITGDTVQMVPATQAALLLPHGVGREGRRCVQIVVVGFASEPFTSGAMPGIEAIVAWLDSWQVPRRWPAGDPLPPPDAYTAGRDRRSWARGGHFGVSQVPHGEGPAPGAIDTARITGHVRPVELPLGEVALPGMRAASILHDAAVPASAAPGSITSGPASGSEPVSRHEPAPVRASSPS
jgi:hypothetical protein